MPENVFSRLSCLWQTLRVSSTCASFYTVFPFAQPYCKRLDVRGIARNCTRLREISLKCPHKSKRKHATRDTRHFINKRYSLKYPLYLQSVACRVLSLRCEIVADLSEISRRAPFGTECSNLFSPLPSLIENASPPRVLPPFALPCLERLGKRLRY